MPANEDTLRTRVYNFYSDNFERGKLHTVQHFVAQGVPKSTVYDILSRFDNELPATRQPGSGGSNAVMTPRKLASLKRLFNQKDNISQRQAAKHFHVSQRTIQNSLRKLNIQVRKKEEKKKGERIDRARRDGVIESQ